MGCGNRRLGLRSIKSTYRRFDLIGEVSALFRSEKPTYGHRSVSLANNELVFDFTGILGKNAGPVRLEHPTFSRS